MGAVSSDPWYAKMAQAARERRLARVAEWTDAERFAHPEEWLAAQPIPEPVQPPDDGTCRECYEWRYYTGSQRHLGQAWWLVCGLMTEKGCDHKHHDNEVWLAA